MDGGLQEAPEGTQGLPGLEEPDIGDDDDKRCGGCLSETAGDRPLGGVGILQEMADGELALCR